MVEVLLTMLFCFYLFKPIYLSLAITPRRTQQSAATLKPPRNEGNHIYLGHSAEFLWKPLDAGVPADILRPIKPTGGLVSRKVKRHSRQQHSMIGIFFQARLTGLNLLEGNLKPSGFF